MQVASAAINIDRTRIIFPGKDKSISLVINNQSKTMPYLAQSWMEDEKGIRFLNLYSFTSNATR